MTDHAHLARAQEILDALPTSAYNAMCLAEKEETMLQYIAALAQVAQPVWSTNKPTVAGWYWWRNKQLKYEEDMEPRIVEVRLYAGDLAIGNCRLAQSSFLKGEWAGPLPLPREA